jgi:hypothetical protein
MFSKYVFSPIKTRYKIWHKRIPIICEIWASHSGAFKDSGLLGCWHFVTVWVVPDVVHYRSVFYLQVQSVQEGLFECLLLNGRNFLPSDTASQLRRRTSSHIDADIIFEVLFKSLHIHFSRYFSACHRTRYSTAQLYAFKLLNSASCCVQVQFIPCILLSTHNARSTCNRHNHFWEISWVWYELNVKYWLLQ